MERDAFSQPVDVWLFVQHVQGSEGEIREPADLEMLGR